MVIRKKFKNYHGINVINSIAKLYDIILRSKLNQCYKPYRELVGAKEKKRTPRTYSIFTIVVRYCKEKEN